MIKLKDILLEGMNKKAIMDVVKKVYPQIVKDLGGSACKVEVHNNIYKRIDAVGIEDLMKDNNPYAEYDWDLRKIYLYSSRIKDVEQIIRSLLHEHTHSRQNKKVFDKGYDDGKTYQNHPYERAAVAAEKRWKKYLKGDLLEFGIDLALPDGTIKFGPRKKKKKKKKGVNECIITHSVLDKKIIMAKNRDRAYTAKVKVVRELVGQIEIVYILDDDTDWSEGMNSKGIGIINSALMVDADEKEKKKIKKGGRPSEDGLKIRRALMYPKLSQTIKSIIKFTGKDDAEVGVKGHTFVASKAKSFAIEMTSEQGPAIKELDRELGHVRTNHGYEYGNAGYTSGQSKSSSHTRWDIAQKVLKKAKKPTDVLDGLSGYYPVNMKNNPYRNIDMVKNKSKKDVLSTTGQLMMNLTDLEFLVRMDSDKSEWLGIEDRTPDYYDPIIKIKVEYVKNTKIR